MSFINVFACVYACVCACFSTDSYVHYNETGQFMYSFHIWQKYAHDVRDYLRNADMVDLMDVESLELPPPKDIKKSPSSKKAPTSKAAYTYASPAPEIELDRPSSVPEVSTPAPEVLGTLPMEAGTNIEMHESPEEAARKPEQPAPEPVAGEPASEPAEKTPMDVNGNNDMQNAPETAADKVADDDSTLARPQASESTKGLADILNLNRVVSAGTRSRWSADRYARALKCVKDVIKNAGAMDRANALPRPILRDEARKRVGDTGMLDHVLKHMIGVSFEDEIICRDAISFEGVNGLYGYWIEGKNLDSSRTNGTRTQYQQKKERKEAINEQGKKPTLSKSPAKSSQHAVLETTTTTLAQRAPQQAPREGEPAEATGKQQPLVESAVGSVRRTSVLNVSRQFRRPVRQFALLPGKVDDRVYELKPCPRSKMDRQSSMHRKRTERGTGPALAFDANLGNAFDVDDDDVLPPKKKRGRPRKNTLRPQRLPQSLQLTPPPRPRRHQHEQDFISILTGFRNETRAHMAQMQGDINMFRETMLAMASAMNELRNEVQRCNNFLQMMVTQRTIERAQPINDDEADDTRSQSPPGFVELMEAFAATAVNKGNTSARPDAAPQRPSVATGVMGELAPRNHKMQSEDADRRRPADETFQMQKNIESWVERQRAKGDA